MANNQSDIEKRRKQRQKKARKKQAKVFFILLLILSVIVFAVLSVTVLFPIKNVSASGSKMYTSEEIIKAAQIKGENIFSFGKSRTQKLIRKKLPFADDIEISVSLPDSVNIKIKDAKEFATYLCNDKYFVVSKNGYVLYEAEGPKEDLLLISSKNTVCNVGEAISHTNEDEKNVINQILSFADSANIEFNTLDVSNINDIKATVCKNFDVEFGTKSYLEKKCSHLKGMLNDIDKNLAGTINLSMWTPKKSEGTFIKKYE